jgi:hypothetical protein
VGRWHEKGYTMKKGIYIKPFVLRLGILGSLVLLVALLVNQGPDIRRYIKFEKM